MLSSILPSARRIALSAVGGIFVVYHIFAAYGLVPEAKRRRAHWSAPTVSAILPGP
jgi:hypothetical protein